jgi:hypothetical protein
LPFITIILSETPASLTTDCALAVRYQFADIVILQIDFVHGLIRKLRICWILFVLFDAKGDVLATGFGTRRDPVHGNDLHPITRMKYEFFSQLATAATKCWSQHVHKVARDAALLSPMRCSISFSWCNKSAEAETHWR